MKIPKILLVDDNIGYSQTVLYILKHLGYEVHTATNGETGVRMALAQRPDLILMDIDMPVMDGFQAVKTLRKQKYYGTIAALSHSTLLLEKIETEFDYIFDSKHNVSDSFLEKISDLIGEKTNIRDLNIVQKNMVKIGHCNKLEY